MWVPLALSSLLPWPAWAHFASPSALFLQVSQSGTGERPCVLSLKHNSWASWR